ncbi:MAG TPA: dihydroorotate dehydrogenase (quinone) [Geobacterales bacterium]|nr:dihydroorotate dehydrogenase (quinone) [Geobacterales bacterium]
MGLYRWVVRPLLFHLDAERSHSATLAACQRFGDLALVRTVLARKFGCRDSRLRIAVAGIPFPSPVGLAAGFDKNAYALEVTSRLGFGALEIGSVSEHPSAGNLGRPRVWRLELDQSLRIHYGCPNDGAEAIAARMRRHRIAIPLGINLVETNTGVTSSAAHVITELSQAISHFIGIADYITLNLSCPNMPQGSQGLFDDPAMLTLLLEECARHDELPPIFLKVAPPGNPEDPRVIDTILEAVDPFAFVKGFILNIHNRKPHAMLRTPAAKLDRMRGQITGPSLRGPVNAAIRSWYARIDRARHALIGVGGIASAEDAYETIRLGASLVQLYTALVYKGPGLIKCINEGLCHLLDRDGLRSIRDAVGLDNGGNAKRGYAAARLATAKA